MKRHLALLVLLLGVAAWLSVLGLHGHDWAVFWAGMATAFAFLGLMRYRKAKKKHNKRRAEA